VVDSEEVKLPLAAVLRMARITMGRVIRRALEDAGYDDLPANGPYVISANSAGGVPLAVIFDRLGLSKQAAGHLVDLLVLRGYLDRHVDPVDRRRLVVVPTERGAAAAVVVRRAADRLEDRLVAGVGAADLEATRRTLMCLGTLGDADA
jgi:DNA-binding MarR family transcriptional regulator